MNIEWKSFSIIFTSLLLTISTTQAQQKDSLSSSFITELDPVAISASLYPTTISKTGRNVLVIKGETFQQLPIHSIDELLRYLPGVEVQQRGPMGSQSDIVLRGGTFQQVLVILDGLRLNDPNTGHFNSYIPVAPTEIERIEIVKGASSAIYGSDAVGGVIYIFTKTFMAKNGGLKKQLSFQGTIGEYKLANIDIGGFYQKNKTAISAGILSNNTDGQLQRGTRGYFNNNTASLSINHYINNNWNISFRSAYDNRKFSAQNFYTSFISDTAHEQVKTFWNQLQTCFQKGANNVKVNIGYKQVQDEFTFNSATTPNNNKSTLLQTLLIYEHSFSTQTILTVGGQFQHKNIYSNDRGNHYLNQTAFFGILNQTIGNYFVITPALRADWITKDKAEIIPQINTSYKKGKIQIRASAGKTIREADFTEQFNNYNKPLVTSGSIGNPALQAERSFSYEGGLDFFFNKNFKFSTTLFQRNQKKLIDWVTTPYNNMPRKDNLSPTGKYALAKNIAHLNTTGIETDVQYLKTFYNQQKISGMLGVTFLNSVSNDTVSSFYISSHARFLFNFNVQYSTPHYNISIDGLYKQRNPQTANAINAQLSADYFTLNAKAEVFVWQKKLSVFIQVDNIFDKNYSDLLGAQMPGRWFMGGCKANLY